MFAASLLVLVNYSLLDQSRASAFSSLTIVSNALMAKFYLKESFTRYDAISAAFILTGVVICGICGSTAPTGSPQTLDQLWAQLSRPVVYAASPLVALLAALLYAFIRYSEARKSAIRSNVLHRLECFARALLAGIFSGSTGFFAKAVVCAVTDSVKTKLVGGSLGNPKFYLFLLCLPCSIFCQLKTLNEGLRAFDTMELVPAYQASVVAVGVSWGWIFYEENKELSYGAEGFFLLGCFVSVTGIAVLTLKKIDPGAAAGGEGEGLLQKDTELSPLLMASPGGTSLVRQGAALPTRQLGGSGAGGAAAAPAPSFSSSQSLSLGERKIQPTRSQSFNPFRSSQGLVPVQGELYKSQAQSFYTPHLL